MRNMTFLKLLLSGCFIVAMALSSVENSEIKSLSADQQIYRLPDYIVPSHYNIKLILYRKQNYSTSHDMFEGKSSISIYIFRKTQDISFHKIDLFIHTLTLINEGNGKIHKPIENSTYNATTHICSFHFGEELLPGLYILNMEFIALRIHNTSGFLKVSYTNGGDTMWLNTTHFQAIGARRVFPCWDEPAFKATFNISIYHHKNYTALSNMPIQSTQYMKNGTMWTHFHTTPVISTYLIAIAITNFPFHRLNSLELQRMWCNTHTRQYTKLAQNVTEIVTSHLKVSWNNLKEISKIDYIVVPEFQNVSNWHFQDGDVISKWGFIFYRETKIIYNEELDPVARKIEVTRLVANKVAYHWFDNLISPSWWSSLWINDGIARLFAVDAINKAFPDSRMLDLFVVQIQRDSLYLDTHSLMKPLAQEINIIDDINCLFTSISYIKAPVIFRMLQHILTDTIFRKGINKYLNVHQFSSTNANDLWTIIQIILFESNYEHKFIKNMMDTWIEQSHYPVLNVTRDHQTNYITISQENSNLKNKWWIPITYTAQTELNFDNTLPKYWLRPTESNITLVNESDWIMLNLQQTGYYRVNYDLMTWRKIIHYLNSDKYTKIHVLNRAQIIDDLFHFAMEKKSNFSLFWRLKTYLSRETDYVAWYPIIKSFEYLSTFIPFSKIGLERRMYKFLPMLLKKIGYQEDSNENDVTKCLRQEITKWACALGDSDCRKNAIVKLEWHLANPKKHKILPWWKDWTFCKGLIKASNTIWMKMLDTYKKEPNNKILEYLTCSEDPYIIQRYLEKISSDDNNIILKNNDRINIFLRIIAKHAKNINVFEYILENFEKIKPRQVNTVVALIIILNHGYTEERQQMILNKFTECDLREQIIETIKYKLSSRKERLEMIQEIMSNNLKEDVMINEEIPDIMNGIWKSISNDKNSGFAEIFINSIYNVWSQILLAGSNIYAYPRNILRNILKIFFQTNDNLIPSNINTNIEYYMFICMAGFMIVIPIALFAFRSIYDIDDNLIHTLIIIRHNLF